MPTGERPHRPPDEVGPVHGPGHHTTAAMQVDTRKPTAPVVRQCESDAWLAGLHRRRSASPRLVPLDCGCRDPWPCRCSDPPLSERMVDAGRDAALHVLDAGEIPLLQIEILQALYRRGGVDRALAEQLHALAGGVVA